MNVYCPEGWLNDTEDNRKRLSSPAGITEALENKQILEAPATLCDASHNLIVNMGCMKGIIPRTEGAIGIEEGIVRDIALISRVGKKVCFTVKNIETDKFGKQYAVLSRKAAQEKCQTQFISGLKPGDIIGARVTHIESFGAFCDIGCGIVALLPIDSISVSRISNPKDRFRVGDDIKVIIKSIMPDGKITLSHKELLGTWEENAANFNAGQTVTGIIRSVEDYGVFVELAPNLAGLAEPRSDVYIGQLASVYIKSILPDKMKIKLIIIDSFDSDEIIPAKYFFEGEHIDSWYYSPAECFKQIYTVF